MMIGEVFAVGVGSAVGAVLGAELEDAAGVLLAVLCAWLQAARPTANAVTSNTIVIALTSPFLCIRFLLFLHFDFADAALQPTRSV